MTMDIKTLEKGEFKKDLDKIPTSPKKLYYKGNDIDFNKKFVCVVGARRYSEYGKKATEKIIRELAGYDITIISGLAIGIDSIAHKAALSSGINTIAVVGSGLDESVLYPKINIGLAREILQSGGTIVSELEEKEKPTKGTFPSRNRIMAGMSDIVIAVECAVQSGTRITTSLAVEYGKEIGAVPNSIFSEVGAGTNEVIKNGANIITSGKDVLEILGIEVSEKKELETLTENEKAVLNILEDGKTKSEIISILNMSLNNLQVTISTLLMKNLVVEIMGKVRKNI